MYRFLQLFLTDLDSSRTITNQEQVLAHLIVFLHLDPEQHAHLLALNRLKVLKLEDLKILLARATAHQEEILVYQD